MASTPLPRDFCWRTADWWQAACDDLVLCVDRGNEVRIASVVKVKGNGWRATVNEHLDWCYQGTRPSATRQGAVAFVETWANAHTTEIRSMLALRDVCRRHPAPVAELAHSARP